MENTPSQPSTEAQLPGPPLRLTEEEGGPSDYGTLERQQRRGPLPQNQITVAIQILIFLILFAVAVPVVIFAFWAIVLLFQYWGRGGR